MTLEQILEQMQSWTEPGDQEIAHGAGDALLIVALKTLAKDHPKRDVIEKIVNAWESIKKYYS